MTPRRGLTLVELMVALAVLGVLAALAYPSMAGLIARKRVEGTAAELLAVLRQARVMPLSSGKMIVVSFGSRAGEYTCYMVHDEWHPVLSDATCNCTSYPDGNCPAVAGYGQPHSFVTNVINASTGVTVSATPNAIAFETQGLTSGGATMTVSITSSASDELRVMLTSTGLATVCSVRGHSGYKSCPE